MKDILHDLADIMSRAARVHHDLTKLQHDMERLMRRIEIEEAAKIKVDISPSEMFDEIRATCDLPLHLDNTCGRSTISLGMLTVYGENANEAVTKLYKLIKYRQTVWQK